MYSKFVHTFYYFNIAVQSIFSLLCPIGLMTLISWLLSSRGIVGEWIYAPLILLGVATGLHAMLRFVFSACKQVQALEREAEERKKEEKRREEKKP